MYLNPLIAHCWHCKKGVMFGPIAIFSSLNGVKPRWGRMEIPEHKVLGEEGGEKVAGRVVEVERCFSTLEVLL